MRPQFTVRDQSFHYDSVNMPWIYYVDAFYGNEEISPKYSKARETCLKRYTAVKNEESKTFETCLDYAFSNNNHVAFVFFLQEMAKLHTHEKMFMNMVKQYRLPRPDGGIIHKEKYWKQNGWSDSSSHFYSTSAIKKWFLTGASVPPRFVLLQLGVYWNLRPEDMSHLLRICGYYSLCLLDVEDLICIYHLERGFGGNTPVEALKLYKKDIDNIAHLKDKENQKTDRSENDSVERLQPYSLSLLYEEIVKSRQLYEQNKDLKLDDLITVMYPDGSIEHIDYLENCFRKVNRGWLHDRNAYIKNLRVSEHDLSPLGDYRRTNYSEHDLSWNENWERMYESIVKPKKITKESVLISGVNSIRFLNDGLHPDRAMKDCAEYNGENRLIFNTNKKQSSANHSFAGKMVFGRKKKNSEDISAQIRKIEMIQYLIATGHENEMGFFMTSSGFWKKNYLNESSDMAEMDLTDLIIVYAMKYRDRLLENDKNLLSEFPLIKLIMTVLREWQFVVGSLSHNQELSDAEIKKIIRVYDEYIPFIANLPRQYPKEDEDDKILKSRKMYVLEYVECSPWIAEFEKMVDMQKGITEYEE
ncbi:hypothetical protein [[Clostridium] aminophilum]|uniref:Uncharacterized protein n=1 Tax=[Clostridium] aminophilum TaxID=1526 RepID=A0A1I6JQN7_9FIRM|nr:hypothetical protein [[Clostridium] aminophilum]SFR81231.1 hypothetical protein SAMN02910262_01795 [[Clostridium] aminophilum]